MAISLTVEGDLKNLTRHLHEVQRKVIPAVTVQALNEVARTARAEGIKEAARKLKLPERIVRKRFSVDGKAKEDRIEYVRANRRNMAALLRVYHRGIPVFQVAGAQNERGVRARGGRLYVGAFKAKGLVFKRRGQERLPLFLPKISVRKTLEDAFGSRTVGVEGRRRFNQAFTQRLAAAVGRL